jgi:hypothetical protein
MEADKKDNAEPEFTLRGIVELIESHGFHVEKAKEHEYKKKPLRRLKGGQISLVISQRRVQNP